MTHKIEIFGGYRSSLLILLITSSLIILASCSPKANSLSKININPIDKVKVMSQSTNQCEITKPKDVNQIIILTRGVNGEFIEHVLDKRIINDKKVKDLMGGTLAISYNSSTTNKRVFKWD